MVGYASLIAELAKTTNKYFTVIFDQSTGPMRAAAIPLFPQYYQCTRTAILF
jgi:hypothetical protein